MLKGKKPIYFSLFFFLTKVYPGFVLVASCPEMLLILFGWLSTRSASLFLQTVAKLWPIKCHIKWRANCLPGPAKRPEWGTLVAVR